MAIVLRWFRALRLSYWRRCKGCYHRNGRCSCRRTDAMLEHILTVEGRKHKSGVRNFSHVSDTAISGTSSGSSGTLLSNGTSFGSDYMAPGEFYRATQQQTSTALVRKNSGTIVPARSYSQDDMNYDYAHEYATYYHDSTSRTRPQLTSSTSMDSQNSIQVYNRTHKRGPRNGSRNSSRTSGADSLIVRPSSSSSVRASVQSDRLSVDNNMGSYNPQSRFYGGNYAPSIQEDDDDAQARLNGLLQLPSPASSTSTTILERSRYHQYY